MEGEAFANNTYTLPVESLGSPPTWKCETNLASTQTHVCYNASATLNATGMSNNDKITMNTHMSRV